MGYQLIKAAANKLPLANESIQCVVTSPPYWGLRKYDGLQDLIWGGRPECEHEFAAERTIKSTPQQDHDGAGNFGGSRGTEESKKSTAFTASCGGTCIHCGAWRGGFGLEPSLKLYIEHTVEILREIRRVLKPDGVVFWNVDDSYAGGGNYRGLKSTDSLTSKQASNRGANGVHQELGAAGKDSGSAKSKDLCLLPQRIAIAAQEDGWWVRQDIIWAKPNPMPESVRDRFTAAYEHIFMFTKSAKYFWDAEACQEPTVSKKGNAKSFRGGGVYTENKAFEGKETDRETHGNVENEKGTRNMRNVWTFATQPFKGAHFATFPEELPRRCIKAATRIGDTVLDPFCGSGTTGKVSLELGRNFVGTDLEYQELAKQRIEKAFPELAQLCPESEQVSLNQTVSTDAENLVFAASEFD